MVAVFFSSLVVFGRGKLLTTATAAAKAASSSRRASRHGWIGGLVARGGTQVKVVVSLGRKRGGWLVRLFANFRSVELGKLPILLCKRSRGRTIFWRRLLPGAHPRTNCGCQSDKPWDWPERRSERRRASDPLLGLSTRPPRTLSLADQSVAFFLNDRPLGRLGPCSSPGGGQYQECAREATILYSTAYLPKQVRHVNVSRVRRSTWGLRFSLRPRFLAGLGLALTASHSMKHSRMGYLRAYGCMRSDWGRGGFSKFLWRGIRAPAATAATARMGVSGSPPSDQEPRESKSYGRCNRPAEK